jgi:phosphoglycerate-specific signal transduction histidine kinase
MAYEYDRALSANRSVNDQITALRLQNFNEELDWLFRRLDSRNLSLTYDSQWRLTTIIDNINSITVTISWVDFNALIPKLYIQETWDTNKFTVTYLWNNPSTIVYWP